MICVIFSQYVISSMRTSLLRRVAMSCLPHTRNFCHEWQKISNMFDICCSRHEWQKSWIFSPHTRIFAFRVYVYRIYSFERRPRLSAAPEWAPRLKLWKFKERRGAQTSKYGNIRGCISHASKPLEFRPSKDTSNIFRMFADSSALSGQCPLTVEVLPRHLIAS